ncbi:MAG: hypothetical protein H7039_24710, partial [Bryobacteraceae bacterium]|nr:hypothetical protein [Bryobacteraceae bacterium]
MSRKTLGLVAIFILLLMAFVATAGLDSLPRELQTSITSTITSVESGGSQFQQNRAAITNAVSSEPVLFEQRSAAWRQKLAQDEIAFDKAASELVALKKFKEVNRREDRDAVVAGVARVNGLRSSALADSKEIRTEAERWLRFKQDLPQHLQTMQAQYDELHSFDVASAAPVALKATTEWPAKRTDLETRLSGLTARKTQGEEAWAATTALREKQRAGTLVGSEYSALFTGADQLSQSVREVKEGSQSLNSLAGQLYESTDKLLLGVDEQNGKRQQVRLVRTKHPDATLANGTVTQEERWEPFNSGRFEDADERIGMVIERKPAGKYDSEVERTAQPPAFGYMAAPGQSNAYGSWSGGVWNWLPQYLVLSHLLQGRSGMPVTLGHYDAWDNARRRGEIYNRYPGRIGRRSSTGGSLRGMFEGLRNGSAGGAESRSRGPSSEGWYRERPKREPGFGE